ncbi:sigma-70 family RNA polymerase sigma factor [Rhodococcus sp. NPDC004095]
MNDDAHRVDVAERFDERRSRLWAVAYRMLGSASEAEDAVQEAWVRLDRADSDEIRNLDGWLTTVVAHVCLNILAARRARPEDPRGVHVPDPVVTRPDVTGPEHEAVLADSVGLAMLVVLDTLAPAERLAFVLHDMFAVPFDEIAPMVRRTPDAARQLASRARRRVRGVPAPAPDRARQRAVVDAFLAAARGGSFEDLLTVLDPDVVLRADAGGAASALDRGAPAVAERVLGYARLARFAHPALVNGAAGIVGIAQGRLFAVFGVTVRGDRIVEIDILADPARLSRIPAVGLD